MASIYGDDGGTIVTGRRRRPTNAGYPYGAPTFPGTTPAPGGGPGGPGGGGPGGPGDGGGGGYDPFDGPGSQGPQNDPPQVDPPVNVPNTPAPKPSRTYANIPGLDTGKLSKEDYKTYKYGDASRAFSSFVGGGGKVGRNQLDDLVKYAREQFGLTNATVVGDDKWDPDGPGGMPPIDVIASDGSLWWGQDGPGGPEAPADPFTAAAGGFGDAPAWWTGGSGASSTPDMSWLGDLLKSFAPQPAAATPAAPVAPPIVVNVPGQQPSYSQPSPSFGGGYVQPGYVPSGDGAMDATTLLSMALPQLLKDPNAMSNPLVRQILQMMQGGA